MITQVITIFLYAFGYVFGMWAYGKYDDWSCRREIKKYEPQYRKWTGHAK